MAPNIPDVYLWLSLGILLPPLIHHVSTNLHSILSLTRISSPLHAPALPQPSTQENAIPTPSLLTLATSPNADIAASATHMLCARFAAHAGARKALLRDVHSSHAHVARRARRAVGVLRDYGYGIGVREAESRAETMYGIGEGVYTEWSYMSSLWDGAEVLEPRVGRENVAGEEREVRRRRREAVVVHDGDVWMRDREGVMGLAVG